MHLATGTENVDGMMRQLYGTSGQGLDGQAWLAVAHAMTTKHANGGNAPKGNLKQELLTKI